MSLGALMGFKPSAPIDAPPEPDESSIPPEVLEFIRQRDAAAAGEGG